MTVRVEELTYRLLPRVRCGRALADSEWHTLAMAADTLLEGCPVDVTPQRVADNVERFLCAGRSRRAFRVRLLLTLLELSTLPAYGGRFSHLDAITRRRVVEERLIGGKALWGLCAKVRLLVLLGAYGDDRAHPAISFVPIKIRTRRRAAPRTEPATALEAAS